MKIAGVMAAIAGIAPVPAAAQCPPRPVVTAHADAADRAIINRVEQALLVAVTSDKIRSPGLRQRMAEMGIPGVSVAVVRNGKLAWAAAWGVADGEACTPLTPATRLQAASISKSVAGLTALAMAQHGMVDLDAPMPKLTNGWQLPPAEGVRALPTLRQLLSHSGGTNVHGFMGYDPAGPVPSVLEILTGTPPANNAPVRLETPPGSNYAYSGGGYTIAQQWLADAGGADFATLATRFILQPARMTDSGFALPYADRASGHADGNRIAGGYRVHPELAAAGLWTTPSDLGRLAMAMQAALPGTAGSKLSKDVVTRAITPVMSNYGIGFTIAAEPDGVRFGHDGVNFGFESKWYANSKGQAIAIMTNAAGGGALAQVLLTTIATAEGWDDVASRQVKEVAWSAAQRANVTGHFAGPNFRLAIVERDGRLRLHAFGADAGELLPIADNQLIMAEHGLTLTIERNGEGAVTRMTMDDKIGTVLTRSTDPLAAIGSVPMFVRGTMNGWTTATPLTPIAQGWAAEVELVAGPHEFKLASQDWSTVDLGAAGPGELAPGKARALAVGGGNIAFVTAAPGKWRIILDMSDRNAPQISVEPL